MPLYEYACRDCQQRFEWLVRGDEEPRCPECRGKKLTKLLSVVSGHVAGGKGTQPAQLPGCGQPQCGMGGCGSRRP